MDPAEADVSGIASQWEARATILARKNEIARSRPATPSGSSVDLTNLTLGERGEKGVVASKYSDDSIQEAIKLHMDGDYVGSTKMYGRLADPKGENNALSQVLYGLALRHGWGCEVNTEEAVKYFSAAASTSADIEELALNANLKNGGVAKGELTLAIYELGNCFRHGWGIPVDKFAAKSVSRPICAFIEVPQTPVLTYRAE